MTDRKHAVTPPTDTPARPAHDPREEADLRAEERAAAERRQQATKKDERAASDKDDDKDENEPTRQGDVLGLSDTTASIPQATNRKGGNPRGIEVGESDDDAGDLKQSPGATSIDMGAAGKGHKVRR